MPVVKKTAAKKKVAPSVDPIVFECDFAKETPGTFQYKEEGERDEQKSGGIYVKKSALPADVSPTRVRVTVEVLEVA